MLNGNYDISLVIVSVLVAVFASYTALALAGRVTHSNPAAARWWIAGGAVAMGTGIWAMHFVGMLAFRLPIPLGYDLHITLLSWAIPIVVSALGLWQVSRARPRWSLQLALSAVIIGAGINAMHYVGMAAMRMEPGIVYDPALVAASLVIAVAAAAVALWIASLLRDNGRPKVWLYRAGAAVVMGFAIVGMHYTGMAAASFPADSVCLAATGSFTLPQLATMVIVATIGILAIALLTAVYDARLEERSQVLALSERTARERQVLLEGERSARAEAERLSALKDEFLATLSHELRTPLNAVLGWVQLLRVKKDEGSLQKGLETIERNARLQARLIEDLLDMSRIVSGQVRLELELIDPTAVVEAAVETARHAAFTKQIELVTRLDAGGVKIWADPSRLQQVMWNLLSNATKFTQPEGRISVALWREHGDVVTEVSDNGCGIQPEFLPRVFDRFSQADASPTRRHGGLGLGLAIVRQLVELHGGTVQARSEGVGRGATFTVRLPLPASKSALPPAIAPGRRVRAGTPEPVFEPKDLSGLTILVVDDEPDARELLEQMLTTCGARVVLAASAEEALAQLHREKPDMVVSDIGMPKIDGFELIRRVRASADARLARLPALALTAFTRREDEQRALRAGFDQYLPKPVDASTLAMKLAGFGRQR
jgi:signal transduction histidine kinase/CheY-like chemotaxis protein